MASQFERYWRILNQTRDYLREGWSLGEEEPPAGLGERPPFAPAGKKSRPAQGAASAAAAEGAVEGAPAAPAAAEAAPEMLDDERRRSALDELAGQVLRCTACRLSESRTSAVPGEGVLDPKVMIIGEAPGAREDESGRPFVGRAGNYLDKWMAAIELYRDRDLFIGNVIKCRPPENRDPFPDETATCIPYLRRQIELIRPRAILTVGRISTHILTETEQGIGRLHGRLFSYMDTPLIPTYHPSGVLRNPQYRAPVWEDLKKLRALIEDHD
jgi:DNA polymerase